MFSYDERVEHVINADSADTMTGEAILYFSRLLARLGVEHIVFGSTALQSYFPYCRRLPGDLDILIDEKDIPRIQNAALNENYVRFIGHTVACKLVYRENFYLHLVPKEMRIVDKVDDTVFTRVNLFFPDRTEPKCLRLIGFTEEIKLQVPVLEYLFCMHMNRALDSNTFSDYVSLLESYSLNVTLLEEFIERVPLIGKVLESRFEGLRKSLSIYRPDLLSRFPKV